MELNPHGADSTGDEILAGDADKDATRATALLIIAARSPLLDPMFMCAVKLL